MIIVLAEKGKTMREKLIELLETLFCSAAALDLSDYLIANGVTVQEWIPVTERLPEVVDSYIVVVKCKYEWEKEYEIGVDVATYDPYSDNPYIDGCWNTYNDWDEGQQYLHVTHWMPLPEPPKGE